MSQWHIGSSDDTQTAAAGATAYTPLLGSFATSATEAPFQIRTRIQYTATYLGCRVLTNASLNPSTLKLRDDGATVNLTCTIGAGATGWFEDTGSSDTVASGSLINAILTVGAGGNLVLSCASLVLDDGITSGNRTTLMAACGAAINSGVDGYTAVVGSAGVFATELYSRYTVQAAAAFSYMGVYLSSNTETANLVVRFRVNGVSGNNVITIGAGATGLFEDTTPHTDSVAAGQTIGYFLDHTSGTGYTLQIIMMESVVGRSMWVGAAHPPGGAVVAFGQTGYLGMGALAGNDTSTETTWQMRPGAYDMRVRNLFVRVRTNSNDGSSTVALRESAGDTALKVTIGAGATGTFADADTDTIEAANHYDFAIAVGGTIGSILIPIIGVEQYVTSEYTQSPSARATGRSTRGFAQLLTLRSTSTSQARAFPAISTIQVITLSVNARGQGRVTALLQTQYGLARTARADGRVRAVLALLNSLAPSARGISGSTARLAQALVLRERVQATGYVSARLLQALVVGRRAQATVYSTARLLQALALRMRARATADAAAQLQTQYGLALTARGDGRAGEALAQLLTLRRSALALASGVAAPSWTTYLYPSALAQGAVAVVPGLQYTLTPSGLLVVRAAPLLCVDLSGTVADLEAQLSTFGRRWSFRL